jgi:protein-tyrosine phosphatase
MSVFDFHTHLLFGVDHGVQTQEIYRKLLLEYHKNGIDTLVLTPHVYHPTVKTNVMNIRPNFEKACRDAEKIGMKLYLGSELYLSSQLEVKSIPVAGRYALCEFPVSSKPLALDRKLQQLTDRGFEIVVAHVERYQWMKPNDDTFKMLREMGAWIQVNVADIENKTAMPYIDADLVDIIASDNHGDLTLPSRLKAALDAHPVIRARMESMGL